MCRFFCLLLLASCAHRVPPPTEALDDARALVAKGGGSARDRALAAFAAWAYDADVSQAEQLFTSARSADAKEPYALMGQLLLARRAGLPHHAHRLALALLEAAPKHPLAIIAARSLVDHGSVAISLDEALLQAAPKILPTLRGDAAHLFRLALHSLALERGAVGPTKWAKEAGLVTEASIVGPLSAFHHLDQLTDTSAEKTGRLDDVRGVSGQAKVRRVRFDDGRLSMQGEPGPGDGFLLAFDMSVPVAGDYVVRTASGFDHVVWVSGQQVFRRTSYDRPAPLASAKAVTLSAGTHRVLVRFFKGDSSAALSVSVGRLDGQPAGLSFAPAQGLAPQWGLTLESPSTDDILPSAALMADRLAPEVGHALAALLSALDNHARDPDGARRLLNTLPTSLGGSLVRSVDALLNLEDSTAPKVSRGRATKAIEAGLEKDPTSVELLLRSARVAIDDARLSDASQLLARAAKVTPPSPEVALLQARVALQVGLEVQALTSAGIAEKMVPGHCEALVLRYDIARRREALAAADTALRLSAKCPGYLQRLSDHRRHRGDSLGSAKAGLQLLELDEGQPLRALSIAHSYVGAGQTETAIALLQRLMATWPHLAALPKALADIRELQGLTAEAESLRERALVLDGTDLQLRQAVERRRTGKTLLADEAISTAEALAAYAAAPGAEEATSALVLDAAAVQVFADGSQVDRIHIIQKALDQNGVQSVAEAHIPQGAQVLTLRTLKADGTTLEPEVIAGKETQSLPGVQVGDLVEVEYLQAHAARGPAQPGFTASSFYFQVGDQPNAWSTYTVVAPRGTGMSVDAHGVTVQPVRLVNGREVFRHDARQVPPAILEPNGPMSGTEYLPYVTVGAGQQGNEGLVRSVADMTMAGGRITAEVEAFAQQTAAGLTGVDAIRAVYNAVHEKLSGPDEGLAGSAAASVAQDRGSRTWLLVAALRALGFDTQVVAVRAFSADPAKMKFPNESLLPYLCVRVALATGPVWLDGMIRHGPFGELPEQAQGREAYVLPRPGQAVERVTTPVSPVSPKEVRLTAEMTADGTLLGTGQESYSGAAAAQLKEALDSFAPDQRRQALQEALSRSFRGAEMSELTVDAPKGTGQPVTVRFTFRAPSFARVDGNTLVLPPLTSVAKLGQRFVQLASRNTDVVMGSSERVHTAVSLKLPKGAVPAGLVTELTSKTKVGRYLRKEVATAGGVTIDETYSLDQARVSPKAYADFARFCGEVDLAQARDVVVRLK